MLKVRNLSSGYGNVPVLRDINFVISAGEIVLVAGENGAGKSTLLRTLAGFIVPTQGSIVLDGRNIGGVAPDRIAVSGLRLVLDGHRVFPEISVWDNLRLGGAIQRDKRKFERAIEEMFEVFPVLKERLKHRARDLSGGQQQMLALAQAFAAQPKILLCDEPSLGLAQALIPPILAFLRKWATNGTAIVLVEQHVGIALSTVDRVILLSRGEVQLACRAAEFSDRALHSRQ